MKELWYDFGFTLPEQVVEDIKLLEESINNGGVSIDCIKEQLRTDAHCYIEDDDKSNEIIDYYYRRRWIND